MENNANQLNSMLCKRNCGFFGNAACDGYCSKCYKDHVKRQNSGSAAGRVTPTSISHSESNSQSQAAAQISAAAASLSAQAMESATATTTTTSISSSSSSSESSSTAQQQPQPQSVASSSSSSHSHQPTSAPIAIPQKHTAAHTETVSSMICESAPAYTSVEHQARQQQQGGNNNNNNNPEVPQLKSNDSSSCSLASSVDLTSTSLSTSSEKKKRTRCCVESCKRKVGLTGFDCRCGGLYCWEHRYSDKHDCKFDYKELGQDQIRKNNPIVVGEKIQKI